MKEPQHPQEKSDRQILTKILQEEATSENLTEVARLLIRYQNFPGARGVHQDLQTILQTWGLTQETLYAKTRQIYASGKLGHQKLNLDEIQDWS